MSTEAINLKPSQTKLLDLTDIKPADIIVTRNNHAQSKVIRVGSCSSYSHALLAIENGQGVEAVGKGTRRDYLNVLLREASYAALYRHKNMNAHFEGWICHYAEEQVRAGKSYDYIGAARAGVATGCNGVFRGEIIGLFIQITDELKKGSQAEHDKSFFCSELVVRAYEEAGLPLVNTSAKSVTPGALVKSNYLDFVKDIKIT